MSLAPRKYVISESHSRRVSRLQAPSFICGIGVIRYFPHGISGRLCKITAEDVIANGRFLVARAPGRAAGTVSTWSRNKLFCDPGAGGLSCAARFAGVRQGQGRALRGLPGRRPQEGSERSPAVHVPPSRPGRLPRTGVFPIRRHFRRAGICVTQGDFEMLYLETRMCNVSLEIYTFSVKDTSAVQDRHV